MKKEFLMQNYGQSGPQLGEESPEKLIDYIISRMQIPVARSTQTHHSMFEAILEECAAKEIDAEESNHEDHQHCPRHEIFKDHYAEQPTDVWFWMDEAPFENILEQHGAQVEDPNHEFHRVKSLREEQQIKIAQFLRDDKYKSLRCIEIPLKGESPQGKGSKSLSPRKTKRIDKVKSFKLMVNSDE